MNYPTEPVPEGEPETPWALAPDGDEPGDDLPGEMSHMVQPPDQPIVPDEVDQNDYTGEEAVPNE